MKGKNLSLIASFVLLGQLGVNAAIADEAIAVISKDAKGNVIERLVSKQEMKSSMLNLLTSVNDSVLNEMGDKEVVAGAWQMKKFSVGLGFEGTVGIGPWDVGASIKQRIIYKR